MSTSPPSPTIGEEKEKVILLNKSVAPRKIIPRLSKPLIVAMSTAAISLLGLFVILFTMSNQSQFSNYLVKEDFKSSKLSPEQLSTLVGMYFAEEDQNLDSIKALHHSGAKIITREKLPEKSRVIPQGAMVTMDWVEDRLNVYLNDESYIKKAKYG